MAAAKPQNAGPAYLDEHHQRISEFANDYFDDDEEREAFVGELMSRRGYRSRTRTDWEPPEPPANEGGHGGKPPAGAQRPAYFKR
jgi:hypothetical protein